MIVIDHVIGNIKEQQVTKSVVEVPYDWFECERKRIRKVAADGAEFGVAVAAGVKDGDILFEDDTQVYVVTLKETRLIAIAVHSPAEAARIGFELGNRHLSLKITDTQISVPYDEPTFLYMNKLGFDAKDVTGSFADYIQCKAHGASVSSEDHGHDKGHDHHHHHGHEHTHVMPDGTVITHSHE